MRILLVLLLLICACAKPQVESSPGKQIEKESAMTPPAPEIRETPQDEDGREVSPLPEASPKPKKKKFRIPMGS